MDKAPDDFCDRDPMESMLSMLSQRIIESKKNECFGCDKKYCMPVPPQVKKLFDELDPIAVELSMARKRVHRLQEVLDAKRTLAWDAVEEFMPESATAGKKHITDDNKVLEIFEHCDDCNHPITRGA